MHKYRYVIDITPMATAVPTSSAAGKYDIAARKVSVTKEVVEMKNNYVVLKLGLKQPGFYSYYVRGIKTDSYTI